MPTPSERIPARLARAGAWLFAVGMITGLWAGLVLTEKVPVRIPRLALAAHLNAILGAFWLIAVASTLDRLRYGETGRRRLAIGVAASAWANWLITLIASVLGVRGLEYTTDPANNIVAALLQVFVVAPSLIAAVAWAWGFGTER
jgi:(hydroxyamino)benzene mutase